MARQAIIQGAEDREVGPGRLRGANHPCAGDRAVGWYLGRGKSDHVVLRGRVHGQQALAVLLENSL